MEHITLKAVITAYLCHVDSMLLSGKTFDEIKEVLSHIGNICTSDCDVPLFNISKKDLRSALKRAGWYKGLRWDSNKEEPTYYVYHHPNLQTNGGLRRLSD